MYYKLNQKQVKATLADGNTYTGTFIDIDNGFLFLWNWEDRYHQTGKRIWLRLNNVNKIVLLEDTDGIQ
jgi:small nuclear ribonucleoprotein (snRNP)-like protein